MERDALKKMGAVCSAAVVVLAFLSVPVMYWLVQAPPALVAGTFAVLLVIAVLMVYYTYVRFREIEEGLEDDLDHY